MAGPPLSASLANLPTEKLFVKMRPHGVSVGELALRWHVFSLACRAARAPNFGPHTETEAACTASLCQRGEAACFSPDEMTLYLL